MFKASPAYQKDEGNQDVRINARILFFLFTLDVGTAARATHTIHGQAADSHSTLSENEEGGELQSARPASCRIPD